MIQRVNQRGAVLLLLLLSAACTHANVAQRVLRVDDILASAGTLEGKQVEVRGFLRFGDDTQNLWTSKGAYSAVSAWSGNALPTRQRRYRFLFLQ
jgi:hypothetical protein